MATIAGERHDLMAVNAGKREIGAYAVGPDTTTFVPAVDVTAIVLTAMAAATSSTSTGRTPAPTGHDRDSTKPAASGCSSAR